MENAESLWKALAGLGVAACAWLGRWAWTKLDAKADRAELRELIERMDKRDEEARASRRALHAKIDETNRQVGATAVSLARLQGQLSRRPDA